MRSTYFMSRLVLSLDLAVDDFKRSRRAVKKNDFGRLAAASLGSERRNRAIHRSTWPPRWHRA